MQSNADFGLREFRPVISGTGLIALDVVIPNDPNLLPQLWAGGTCGNVLTALSFLGWEAIPIARLGNDSAAERITQDFERWGVRLDHLGLDSHGSTPVIVQHIHCSPERGTTHSFSRKCPNCGKRLPWYKPVRVSDARKIVLTLPPSAVFFFDRTSAGALQLARHAAENGALVVFEPSASSDDKELGRAMKVAHIVKYSRERFAGLDELPEASDLPLLIETKGSEGLRFLSRLAGGRKAWELSESLPAKKVVDTAGCGDWCTAGIIGMLGTYGRRGFERTNPTELQRAIRFGQALAAWNCGFEGARGGMYGVDEKSLKDSFEQLLAGTGLHTPNPQSKLESYGYPTEYICVACGECGVATR